MIAFTILGLLVFWLWCFQTGYWLGFCAHVLGEFLGIVRMSRRVSREIEAFAFAASQAVTDTTKGEAK